MFVPKKYFMNFTDHQNDSIKLKMTQNNDYILYFHFER